MEIVLIADGGSTKCDWIALNRDGEVLFKTQTLGLNPSNLSTQKIHRRIAENEQIAHVKGEVGQIYFYGAGCGTAKSRGKIRRFFKNYFVNSKNEVRGDLFAACMAVTKSPGIVCILGTGSNSCYFDGQETLTTNAPAMGYTLMDEASGNYFGKALLNDYYYNRMPKELRQKFEMAYNLEPHIVRNQLYQEPNPNVYLARFSSFIFQDIPFPDYQSDLLVRGFKSFIENRVLPYIQSKELPVHFVGSIAYFAKPILSPLLREYGLKEGTIIRRPIEGLMERIRENLMKT